MDKSVKRISLNGEWRAASVKNGLLPERQGEYKELSFVGHVPGSTLSDLIKAGITVGDIFYRDNAETVQHFESYNWTYSRVFEFSGSAEGAVLVFERLDTYCDIYLNGTHIAFCDNGYIEHRFAVDEVLRVGENKLDLHFYSPINYTLGKKRLNAAFTRERLYNRRIQCTYGWDWTMRFVTTGIYGDCYIELPDSDMRVESAYIYTKSASDAFASVGFDITLHERSGEGILDFEIISPSGKTVRRLSRFCREKFFRFSLDLRSPELWYPIGYGAQPIYTLSVKSGDREIFSERFGIRIVQILQLPDEVGSEEYVRCLELKTTDFSQIYDKNEEFSGFTVLVNGVKILCRGANWVPLSPFETEGLEDKIERVLRLSAYAGVNMLRVWGGGYIEKRRFYDCCSRLGILVLQDFFMACGQYPEKEDWFISQLRREAEYTVKYLRNQPCLAWWHGDNENAVNGCGTDSDYQGRDSAYLGLAERVWSLDPYREFLPSSPFGGNKYASNTVGTTHNTQYLVNIFEFYDKGDITKYKEYTELLSARFISEEPCFGSASLSALKKMMSESDIYSSDDTMWKYHTQNNPGLEKHLLDYYSILAERVLGRFVSPSDRLFKLQYIQCELVRLSLERMRREPEFNSGVLFWMLADCWPAACGWSLIDYYGGAKPALYTFKRMGMPLRPAFGVKKDGALPLVISNIFAVPMTCEYEIISVRGSEMTALTERTSVTVGARANVCLHIICPPEDGELLVCRLTCGEESATAFYKDGTLALKEAKENVDYTVTETESEITITASTYLQAAGIEFEDECALSSDNYFSLLPGESKTVTMVKGDKKYSFIRCYGIEI